MNKKYHIISYLFENSYIISLSKEWLEKFNGIPEFDVYIDNDRLHLISQKISNGGDNNYK